MIGKGASVSQTEYFASIIMNDVNLKQQTATTGDVVVPTRKVPTP
jgi:hypothetical protein